MAIGDKHTILGEEFEEIEEQEWLENCESCKDRATLELEIGTTYEIKYFKKVEKNPFGEIKEYLDDYSRTHDTRKSWNFKNMYRIIEEQLKKEKENDNN